jgi:hypothetical protein
VLVVAYLLAEDLVLVSLAAQAVVAVAVAKTIFL